MTRPDVHERREVVRLPLRAGAALVVSLERRRGGAWVALEVHGAPRLRRISVDAEALDDVIAALCTARAAAVATLGAGRTWDATAAHGTYPDPYERAAPSGEEP